ncbi:hypothetical protein ES703_100774 [subsurface metagenome]
MPFAEVIGASYAHQIAMDLSRKNRDVVRSDKYQHCFGRVWNEKKEEYRPYIKMRDDQAAKTYFMNTKGGSRFSAGVGGAITGMHGHFLIVDDPLNPNEAVSEAELANANRWMSETLPTRKISHLVTPTILIMQRLHQDDPTANMLAKTKRIKHICLPAETTKNIKPKKLTRFYKEDLMDPKRFPRKVLDDNRILLGEYGYAGQFLQSPVPLGGGMFKTDRITIDEPPKKWKMRVRFWDKAGTKGGGAFSVGVLMGRDRDDRYWIMDDTRGQWDSSRREAIIKSTAILDTKDIIIGLEQEPGSAGKESAQNTVKNLAGWIVKVERPTGDKATRADPFSVQVNNGNVYMVRGDWNRDYINELQFFPLSKYKDQVDASSGAFNILAKGKRKVGCVEL